MILEVGGKIRWLSTSIETPETVREKDFRVHSNNHSINKLINLKYNSINIITIMSWILFVVFLSFINTNQAKI